MSHAKWLARYKARAQRLYDRFHELPSEKMESWWAPECPDEPPTPTGQPEVEYYPWWVPDRPPDAPIVVFPRYGDYVHYDWRGLEVDAELKPEWLERLNALPNVEIALTCAGHVDQMYYPAVEFLTKRWGGNGAGDVIHRLIGEDFGDLSEAVAWEVHETGAGGYKGHYGKIVCSVWFWVPRIWMSLCEFVSWWEQVIGRLEKWTPDLPYMVRTER